MNCFIIVLAVLRRWLQREETVQCPMLAQLLAKSRLAKRRTGAGLHLPLQWAVSALDHTLVTLNTHLDSWQQVKENKHYKGSSSEDDDESPREVTQKNGSGSSDFCVRKIAQHSYGRREIEVCSVLYDSASEILVITNPILCVIQCQQAVYNETSDG